MPGLGVRTAARILLEIGDISAFATPGHLAAYAGLAPVTKRSGSSIKDEHQGQQQGTQARRVPVGVRVPVRPPEQDLLRQERGEGKNTTPPSSAWPAAAQMSSTPCSATGSLTGPIANPQLKQHELPKDLAPDLTGSVPRRDIASA